MNKVELVGRLTREPQIYHGENGTITTARYTLAVDRKSCHDADEDADYIGCVAFGKSAEFAEHYLCKGIKIAVTGHLQSGSYTNKEDQKIYTTDVVIEEQEFVETKEANEKHLVRNRKDSNQESADAGLPFIKSAPPVHKGKA